MIGTDGIPGLQFVKEQGFGFHREPVPVFWIFAVFAPFVDLFSKEYLIEKCTELGVAAIWPMITARTVAKPGQAAVEKWRRRAIEAAKQSGRRWLPDIASPQPFDQVLSQCSIFDRTAIAHADDRSTPAHEWLGTVTPGSKILVLVGPEGGWTDEERETATSAGLSLVKLTAATLRTETAAVAFAAISGILVPGP